MHSIEQIDLRRLSEISAPEQAFLSLYVSQPRSLVSLSSRINNARHLLGDSPDELEHFEHNVRLLEKHLEDSPLKSGAMCVLVCWAEDLIEDYRLELPLPDLLIVDSSPYIRPLARLQDEYEEFAVVVADNTAARVFMVSSARHEHESRVRGNVKNHVRKGGWSQQRYERRRDKQLQQYSKQIVERLIELEREDPFTRLMMVGSRETLAEIQRELPDQLLRKLVGTKPLDLGQGEQFVDHELFQMLAQDERRQEADLWQRIRSEYLRHGLAAVGPQDVLEAVQQGRVDQALINIGCKIPGTRCRDCEHLAPQAIATCPACGSSSVFEVDLVEQIVDLLKLTSAHAEFAEPLPGLAKLGDLAALLRY
ncbi:MAG: Vms1/Ankzf1 family peptidyl-tRNA hydrolase [Candidatus Alcyoniella australis]|nr:Vms1/Ankzf1 family peptidyl-tRNA hydrolase [Candidatus Alcyoniella australis]